MLYALLVEAKVDVTQLAEQGKGLDNLARHAKLQGVIPRAMRDHLDSAQKYGNSATHFQPDGLASEANATIVASALSELARWFYARDDRPLPAALHGPIAALIDERQRLRSPAELALEQERRRAHDLAQRLHAAANPFTEQPPAPFTARLAAIGVGLVALGAALGFGVGWITLAPTSTATAPSPTVGAARMPPVAPVASPAPPEITPTIRVPVPVPVTPPGRSDCESRGMRYVGVPGAPGTFCIDRELVQEGEYRRCVSEQRCPHPPPVTVLGANWNDLNNDGLAANYLPAPMALQYCRQRLGPGSDLPTRAERDLAAQARVVVGAGLTTEWLGDRSNDGMRGVRGDLPARDETRGYRDVSFRCVLRAEPR